jgi:outer membrane protein assembly factor BamB
VAGGRAFTLGWDGENDTVFCFDAASGKVLWKDSYPCGKLGEWPGPRATPTVAGDLVFTLSQHGELRAYDVATGRWRWRMELSPSRLPNDEAAFAWSPLVEGDLLILAAGRQGLAFRAADAAYVWGMDGRLGAYTSPIPYTVHGRRGVAVLLTNPKGDGLTLTGVDPGTGAEQWRYGPVKGTWGAAVADVIVRDGAVFVTTAEQFKQAGRVALGPGGEAKLGWTSRKLVPYTGGCVLVGEHLYGVAQPGILKCVDWASGREKWSERGFGEYGSLIAADGKLIIQGSSGGKLAVVEATPEGYRELRSAKVFAGKPHTFTAPVLANGRVYCRSYAGEVVCLQVGK